MTAPFQAPQKAVRPLPWILELSGPSQHQSLRTQQDARRREILEIHEVRSTLESLFPGVGRPLHSPKRATWRAAAYADTDVRSQPSPTRGAGTSRRLDEEDLGNIDFNP